MARGKGSGSRELERRIERTLLRCVEWSQTGRHRKVLGEVERILSLTREHPHLEAQLLVWKAQALLSMGCADRALPAAERSWQLDSSPHACHLMSNALNAMGSADESEQMLRMGWGLFPDAVHLPVQLAMMLTDQGRLPEALDTLQDIPDDLGIPDDLQVFLFGMRANLLATVGRWTEARDMLEQGLDLHPGSSLLEDAQESLQRAWQRSRREHELCASWHAGLDPLDGIAAEVDDAIVRTGAVHELSTLIVLAARRLWRAFFTAEVVRPQMPEPWGAAMIVAVLELDGQRPSAAAMARSLRTSATATQRAARRVAQYLEGLEPELARRSFAANANSQLNQQPRSHPEKGQAGTVIPFPGVGPAPDDPQ